ncbi:hypothetical protein Tco_1259731 [Tanacetum coccineum]
MDKCATIGYGFLPFSFSSLGELEADAVTLLKQIRKFSMTQDIGARVAIHIFNMISFAIAKGVGAQIVSRLPFNFFIAWNGDDDVLDILGLDSSILGMKVYCEEGKVLVKGYDLEARTSEVTP